MFAPEGAGPLPPVRLRTAVRPTGAAPSTPSTPSTGATQSTGAAPAGRAARRRVADDGRLGVLAERARPTAASRTRLLVAPGPLVPLLPDGGLRRGSVVHCAGDGALSLALAMAGPASAAGSWCALVGVDDVGALAAAGYGVDLRRLAVVRAAPAEWASVAGCLAGGVDVVVVQPPGRARPPAVRILAARARRHGAVLVVLGPPSCWPAPVDVLLEVEGRWQGLARGGGRLRGRRVTVTARGRGVASRPVRRELWLPTAGGTLAASGDGDRDDGGAGGDRSGAAGDHSGNRSGATRSGSR